MKNNSNALAQIQCEYSEFILCNTLEANRCPKAQGELAAISNINLLDNSIVQLNQMETSHTFYNEHINSLFIVKEEVIKPKQLAQPLKRLNTVVSDTVGFTIFCILLIATGMLVWADFLKYN